MRVRLLYFASVRERAGTRLDELDLADDASLSDALAAAQTLRPRLLEVAAALRFARNGSFCGVDEPLSEGDELAIIPPVSGG